MILKKFFVIKKDVSHLIKIFLYSMMMIIFQVWVQKNYQLTWLNL